MLRAHRTAHSVARDFGHEEVFQLLMERTPEDLKLTLAQKRRKVVALALRQLLRLLREYPREPFLAAVEEAARYGLYDLDRVERMILRRVARDYFLLGETEPNGDD